LRNGTIHAALEMSVAEELVIEAEYYGEPVTHALVFAVHTLRFFGSVAGRDCNRPSCNKSGRPVQTLRLQDGLVKVLRSDVIDIKTYLGREIAQMRDMEMFLRAPLSVPKAPGTTDGSVVNPHEGLISLFDDDGALDQMNNSSEDPIGFTKFLSRFGASPSNRPVTPDHANLPTTVADLRSFKNNFRASFESVNCDPFDILERLDFFLKQHSILIAGVAVLRALTSSAEIDAGVCPNWAIGACNGRPKIVTRKKGKTPCRSVGAICLARPAMSTFLCTLQMQCRALKLPSEFSSRSQTIETISRLCGVLGSSTWSWEPMTCLLKCRDAKSTDIGTGADCPAPLRISG